MPDRIDILEFRGIWRVFLNGRELGRPFSSQVNAWRFLAAAREAYCATYGVKGTALGWDIPELPPETPKAKPKPLITPYSSPARLYALQHPGQTLRRRDIQKASGLSAEATRQVLQRMARDGLVERRGKYTDTVWYVKPIQGENAQ